MRAEAFIPDDIASIIISELSEAEAKVGMTECITIFRMSTKVEEGYMRIFCLID